MIFAAGIMFVDPAGKVLFLKRGAGSDHPFEWCFPGGQADEGETALQTAMRETIEEVGFLPQGRCEEWTRRVSPVTSPNPTGPYYDKAAEVTPPSIEAATEPVEAEKVDFTTFKQFCEPFIPQLSDEHTAYCWADPKDPPQPLHPGAEIAVRKLGLDELGIARAMAAGELTSPQVYHNLHLFAMRITGTGLAYRNSWQEFVWRDKSLYLNDEFLARCNGLPVIWEHPPTDTLNTKEFAKRVIGTIMLPYIQGDDVWGVAKILDQNAAKAMTESQLSTSPAVVMRNVDSQHIETEKGNLLLIEGKPTLLDHLAVCAEGVWDKQGPPVGILNDLLERVDSMAEEKEEKKADMVDAGSLTKMLAGLDSLMSKVDAMCQRQDAMHSRMDAMEAMAVDKRKDSKEEEERKDARKDGDDDEKEEKEIEKEERKDAHRKDGHRKDAKRDDASEKEEEEEEERGEPEEPKADRKRKDAKREDARHDAQTAATIAEMQAQIDALKATQAKNTIMRPDDVADYHGTFGQIRSRLDSLWRESGRGDAPPAYSHETQREYRIRLLEPFVKYSADFKDTPLSSIHDSVVPLLERNVIDAAMAAMRARVDLPDGTLIPHSYTDPVTKHAVTEWRGNGRTTVFHKFNVPPQYVTQFKIPERRV